MRSVPDMASEALRSTDLSHQGAEVARQVQTQLTGTADIKAAHQWIQPTGGEAHLPNVAFHGAEAAGMHVMVPGSESGALAAAHQVGNQAVSPIIQMIMRMPGHLGLVSSFFECMSTFFAPIKEMLSGLDLSALVEHAHSAVESTTAALGEHLPIDLSLLPSDAPILSAPDLGGAGDAFSSAGQEIDLSHFQLSEASTVQGNPLDTSGYADAKTSFENLPNNGNIQVPENQSFASQYLAMDNGQAIFRPTVGGGVQAVPIPNSATPSLVPPSATPSVPHPAHVAAPHVTQHAIQFREASPPSTSEQFAPPDKIMPVAGQPHADVSHAAGHQAHTDAPHQPHAEARQPDAHANSAHPHAEAAHAASHATERSHASHSAPAEPAHSARGASETAHAHHAEATHPNQPAHAVESQPGTAHESNTVASSAETGSPSQSDYVVHQGDNLWNIARDQLGDGSKWHQIFDLNHDVLGSNPSMIHTGTTLHMPGAPEVEQSASTYTVHHGDTLWDISKQHLGGGEHWGELFHQNEAVIGSNPSMLHPGQHLTISGEHGRLLAQVSHGDGVAASHHVSHTAASHSAGQPHAHSHANHGKISSASTHSDVASAPQPTEHPQVIAQIPRGLSAGGQDGGMHTTQAMGRLEPQSASYDPSTTNPN